MSLACTNIASAGGLRLRDLFGLVDLAVRSAPVSLHESLGVSCSIALMQIVKACNEDYDASKHISKIFQLKSAHGCSHEPQSKLDCITSIRVCFPL
jgi:hypothetical protein